MKETKQEYLHLETQGYIGIHYFSIVNHFMDCLVWVKPEDVKVAKQCISDGIKEFYDAEYEVCFTEVIENELIGKNIHYQIEFDSMLNDYSDETSDDWDEYASKYESYTRISD